MIIEKFCTHVYKHPSIDIAFICVATKVSSLQFTDQTRDILGLQSQAVVSFRFFRPKRTIHFNVSIHSCVRSRGSSVSIVSDYGLDDRQGQKIFPIQWVPGRPFPGGKARPGRDAGHSPPSSAEVKNE
jgi:hypothetical protein